MRPGAWIRVGCLTLLTAGTARAQAGAGEAVAPDAGGAVAEVPKSTSSSQAAATNVPPLETRRWYGWQTLIVDGAAVVLIVGGGTYAAAQSSGPTGTTDNTAAGVGVGAAVVGFGAYTFGGPIVHWAHGNVWKGFASLGLNLGMPAAIGGVGAWACETSCRGAGNGYGGLYGFLYGAGIGMVAAQVIDVGLLAYEPVVDDHTASREAKPAPSLMPEIAFTPDRTTWVGLRGVF